MPGIIQSRMASWGVFLLEDLPGTNTVERSDHLETPLIR
jgi:hypothetical protein